MSTKNLSRTVIEGGRCGHYKADVRSRARQERAQTRAFLHSARVDPESVDDRTSPIRTPEYPCFADKTNPLRRFLDSRVGRSWASVRSELFQKFDARTTPGRHVLFDHLLKDVSENSDPQSPDRRYKSYFLDTEGRLCKDPERFRRRQRDTWQGHHALAAWLGSRKLGRMGKHFAWFVPVTGRVRVIYERGAFVYALLDEHGDIIRDPRPPYISSRGLIIPQPPEVRRARMAFRQHGRLDEGDAAYFRALPSRVQEEILAFAPANV